MTTALVRPPEAIRWELRAAWASGKRVALTVENAPRVEGHVEAVATSGAFVIVAGCHVPADLILAVHYPSLLGDSSWRLGAWSAPGRSFEVQRERLWYDDREVGAGPAPAAYVSKPRIRPIPRETRNRACGARTAYVAGGYGV